MNIQGIMDSVRACDKYGCESLWSAWDDWRVGFGFWEHLQNKFGTYEFGIYATMSNKRWDEHQENQWKWDKSGSK